MNARSHPEDRADREERRAVLGEQFRTGEIRRTIYEAKLFGLGLSQAEITEDVNTYWPRGTNERAHHHRR